MSYQDARDALLRTVLKVWPDAKPAPRWSGVEAWGAPRPEAVVDHDAPGTYDPKVTLVGIADRKQGPTIYFLDPGDYFVLDTHKALLADAGLKVGRGCIYHTRKGPLPVDALEELFRRVKERDARAAEGRAPAEKPVAPRGARGERAANVDDYLRGLPDRQRMALERLRKLIRAAAPEATEKISYGMPTFVHQGNLVHFAAFRDHCSFFPGSGALTAQLADELARFETAKGTIRFEPHRPLPPALVKKIVKMRVAENEARAARKRGAGTAATKTAAGPAKKHATAPAKKATKKPSGRGPKRPARG